MTSAAAAQPSDRVEIPRIVRLSIILGIIQAIVVALFAVATELGARLNGQSESLVAAMRSYGMKLGTAYQIYDDCIDLVGDEKAIGKTLGTDLAKGKLTLPMLYLLRDATDQQRTKLQRMVLKGEPPRSPDRILRAQ